MCSNQLLVQSSQLKSCDQSVLSLARTSESALEFFQVGEDRRLLVLVLD